VEQAMIRLYDDSGNSEDFTEQSPGVYTTGGIIQGQVGHSYHIRVETSDGRIFESIPDRINPVGEVDTIRYEFEARTEELSFGVADADVFNIYVDSEAGTGNSEENYVRWKFKGTYKVFSNPELHLAFLQVSTYLDPRPCSGYIVVPALGGGKLEKVGDCTCCICWVNQFEETPQLSDTQLISGGSFNDVKIAEVPINSSTFYEKYLVEVEQMSLSRTSFDFFRLIRGQKENASSLFQPPSGEIRGNIRAVNSDEHVIGIFWATAVRYKSLYIDRSAVPYTLPPIVFVPDACTSYYRNSTTTKPDVWQ
jgi:hypothetical protein